jgi:ribosomal protein S14
MSATLRARSGTAIRFAPNEGKRRQSERCLRCPATVSYFERPRLVLCRTCWRDYWHARDGIVREMLATAFPAGRPRITDPLYRTDYAAWAERDRAYRIAEARLNADTVAITDAAVFARMPSAISPTRGH